MNRRDTPTKVAAGRAAWNTAKALRRGAIALVMVALAAVLPAAEPGSGPGAAGRIKYKVAFATYLGGSQYDDLREVIVDKDGSLLVGGQTVSPDLCATCLGGKENEFAEHRLALLDDGSVLLTGVTASRDFPTTTRAFQRKLRGKTAGFLTKLAPQGREFVFSTLLGGSGGEFLLMPTTDAEGNIYVVGHTSSPDLPVTPGAIQTRYGGHDDGVLAIFSPDGSRLLYLTYLGGEGEDLLRSLAIGPDGALYLIGKTASDDFPVTDGAAQGKRRGGVDAFVVKLVRE